MMVANGRQTRLQETLASKKSKQANFVKPLPVYIVYFSVAANTDGSIVNYDDMYKRDGKVIAALLDTDGKAPGRSRLRKVATKSRFNRKGGSIGTALPVSFAAQPRRPAFPQRSSGRRPACS